MIIRASTVVELPAGTTANVASTVATLRLVDRCLAQMASEESYAGGLLRGAYVDLLVDALAKAEDGSLVDLPRGTTLFVPPGTVVAVVSKLTDMEKTQGCECPGLAFAAGVGVLGVVVGIIIASE